MTRAEIKQDQNQDHYLDLRGQKQEQEPNSWPPLGQGEAPARTVVDTGGATTTTSGMWRARWPGSRALATAWAEARPCLESLRRCIRGHHRLWREILAKPPAGAWTSSGPRRWKTWGRTGAGFWWTGSGVHSINMKVDVSPKAGACRNERLKLDDTYGVRTGDRNDVSILTVTHR